MVRRINIDGKGLIGSILIKKIIKNAHKKNKLCKIDIRPLRDTFRPFESKSETDDRLKSWYGSLGFQIQGNKGYLPVLASPRKMNKRKIKPRSRLPVSY